VKQKPPQDHLFEVTLYVITNPKNMGNFKAKERCRLSQVRFDFYVYGIFVCNMFWSEGIICS